MKGIIYTRVSSAEQIQGMSLDFQREDCLTYAKDKGIEIAKIYEEKGESAKFANRPELIKLLEFCRTNKKKIDFLIVWKMDRLSRNQMDYYYLKKTLLEYGVSVYSATEHSMEDTSSVAGKVFETFAALSAEIDNMTRRERAISGMERKLVSGIYPWKPPLGYKCAQNRLKGLKKTEPDQPDNEKLPIIERIFKTCLEQRICNNVELARLANGWGLRTETGKKIYPQIIDRILGNKFYCGLIHNPWKNEDIEGKHRGVISPENFNKVQWLRKGHGRIEPENRKIEHPDFPLRKTSKCSSCSNPLTGSWSRGNGGKYAYYHCSNKKCEIYGKAIKKIDMEKDFVIKLEKITPTQKALRLFKETVMDVWDEEIQNCKVVTKRNKAILQDLEERLDGIILMKAKGQLTDDEFTTRKEKLNNEIAGARIVVSESELGQFNVESILNYATHNISNLPRFWFELSPQLKTMFQKAVFPVGIPYEKKKGFGTAKLGLVYELI